MVKSGQNITLTCNEIKRVLGLKLTPEESTAEAAWAAAREPKRSTTRKQE